MLSEKEAKKVSKFLSFILRHKPDHIGLQLDSNGWADITTLISRSNESGISLTREILLHIVETNTKKRFALDTEKDKIRASQGHSIDIELALKPVEPPGVLYHGTAQSNIESILDSGLVPKQRQHVHLSVDTTTAKEVGSRHGRPVVLEIASKKMFDDGFHFFLSDNGVWLTDSVPSKFIKLFKSNH